MSVPDESVNLTNSGGSCKKREIPTLTSSAALTKSRREVRRLRSENWPLCKSLASARKVMYKKSQPKQQSLDDALKALAPHLEPLTLNLVKLQISLSGRKSRGRRYGIKDKVVALSLYLQSPACYKRIRKIIQLPCKTTLLRLIRQAKISPGFNSCIFDALSIKMKDDKTHNY